MKIGNRMPCSAKCFSSGSIKKSQKKFEPLMIRKIQIARLQRIPLSDQTLVARASWRIESVVAATDASK